MKKRFLDIVTYLIIVFTIEAFFIVSIPWVIFWAIHEDKSCTDALEDAYETLKAKFGD